MRPARLLSDRWRKFVHEALKFGIVGGFNTVVNYAVFNALALTLFVDGQLKATVIATIVATISSYLMNRHWTYRDRPKSAMRREYSLFFLFNATGLVIELGVLAMAKYGLGFTGLLALNIAKTGGVVLATVFRFWSYRTFVFQPVPVHAESSQDDSSPGDAPRGDSSAEDTDVLAELDPVAELAEAVTDLEESGPSAGGTATSTGRGTATSAAESGPTATNRLPRLKAELADTMDVELEADLVAELGVADWRPATR
jgi:putative flippase GtrA